MKSIVLEVTLTGATGEVSGIPGAHGHIMSYRINYTGQSGDTADVTLYETIDGADETLLTLANQNTDKRAPLVYQADGTDGADVTDQYGAGIPIFGGSLKMTVAGAAAGSIKLMLNVLE